MGHRWSRKVISVILITSVFSPFLSSIFIFERFHALGPIYYRDASGALLVYDITDAESFNKVKNWVKELRKIVGSEIIIVIAGNKIDLEKNRHVNEEEAVR
jgi:Ras-related protein Rab-21